MESDRLGVWLNRSLGGLAGVLLFAIMVLTFVDVMGRYLFSAPLPGAYEITELMLGSLIFAALPLVTVRAEHVTIDLLDPMVPRPWRGPQRVAVNFLAVVTLAVMSAVVWDQAEKISAAGLYTEALEIPSAPVAYFISVMAGFTSLLLLTTTIRSLLRRRIDKP